MSSYVGPGDYQVAKTKGLDQFDVVPSGDPPIHYHGGKVTGEESLLQVIGDRHQNIGDGLWFWLVPRIDAAIDRQSPVIYQKGQTYQCAVVALLLGVAVLGEIVAEDSAFKVGVGEIKEKEALLCRKELVLVLDQCRFDTLFGFLDGIGDLLDGVLANLGEVAADKLRES